MPINDTAKQRIAERKRRKRAERTPEQIEKEKERRRNSHRTHKRPESSDAYKKRRLVEHKEMLNAYKLEKGCVVCGYNAHFAALEFDHLPENVKRETVGSMLFRSSWKAIMREVDKCEVVCANCHRIRTYNRRYGLSPAADGGE